MIYLTVIRPNVTFTVKVLSKFMHQLRETHWTTALMILAYVKSSPRKGLLYKKHGYIHIFDYPSSGYAGDKGCWLLHIHWRKSDDMEEQEVRCF